MEEVSIEYTEIQVVTTSDSGERYKHRYECECCGDDFTDGNRIDKSAIYHSGFCEYCRERRLEFPGKLCNCKDKTGGKK